MRARDYVVKKRNAAFDYRQRVTGSTGRMTFAGDALNSHTAPGRATVLGSRKMASFVNPDQPTVTVLASEHNTSQYMIDGSPVHHPHYNPDTQKKTARAVAKRKKKRAAQRKNHRKRKKAEKKKKRSGDAGDRDAAKRRSATRNHGADTDDEVKFAVTPQKRAANVAPRQSMSNDDGSSSSSPPPKRQARDVPPPAETVVVAVDDNDNVPMVDAQQEQDDVVTMTLSDFLESVPASPLAETVVGTISSHSERRRYNRKYRAELANEGRRLVPKDAEGKDKTRQQRVWEAMQQSSTGVSLQGAHYKRSQNWRANVEGHVRNGTEDDITCADAWKYAKEVMRVKGRRQQAMKNLMPKIVKYVKALPRAADVVAVDEVKMPDRDQPSPVEVVVEVQQHEDGK